MSHTPGPWIQREQITDHCGVRITADETSIAYVGRVEVSKKQYEANARLIAAAPEMLEALQWVMQCLDGDLPHGTQECLANARAVILKATGE
jgi:hypothetical protein